MEKPYRFQNQASTTGDQSNLRLYGHVLNENRASWEYDSRGFRRNGRVPKVIPIGIPCKLGNDRRLVSLTTRALWDEKHSDLQVYRETNRIFDFQLFVSYRPACNTHIVRRAV